MTDGHWQAGSAPIAIILISLNEAHNMEHVLRNLNGWAHEVFLVDSYSTDDTIDIALRYGVKVVQRKFRGFGEQWNFAIEKLQISSPWTMKLDPDERLTDKLKSCIEEQIAEGRCTGISFNRQLYFMGKPLPIRQEVTRIWKTGECRFTDVGVNEHPIVFGKVAKIFGELEHHDSPNLHHWFDKQNKYSTTEAEAKIAKKFATTAKILGTPLERRMWMKKHFDKIPMRFSAVFLYYFIYKGLWKAGWNGYVWSRLRSHVYFMRYLKFKELLITECKSYVVLSSHAGVPDSRVKQY